MEPSITPEVWAAVLHELATQLAIQPPCDVIIASHPDLAELNVQLDAWYDI